MKYFLQIILAFVVAASVITGVYYYMNNSLPFDNPLSQSTTVTKLPITEKYSAKTLLASLDKEKIRLYKSNKLIILEFKGKYYEFENWNSSISDEKPKIYYFDLDKDKQKEILVRGVSGKDEVTGEYIYNIYILNPKKDGDGWNVTLISQDDWRTILNDYTMSQITQLKHCSKTVQFAMNVKDKPVKYNDETGIAENGHAYYARALQDENGKYMTVDTWIRGKGIYTINKKNHICADVDVIVSYKNSDKTQNLGNVKFEISFSDNNTIKVTDKTLEFVPSKKYRAAPPLKTRVEPFSYTEQNTFAPKDKKEISYFSYSPKFDGETVMQTVNLSGETSDAKYIKQINITEKSVVLTAAEGSTFSSKVVNSPEFSVIINKGDKNSEYDIAYTAVLDSEKKVLTINFDRIFAQNEIKTVEINFGK